MRQFPIVGPTDPWHLLVHLLGHFILNWYDNLNKRRITRRLWACIVYWLSIFSVAVIPKYSKTLVTSSLGMGLDMDSFISRAFALHSAISSVVLIATLTWYWSDTIWNPNHWWPHSISILAQQQQDTHWFYRRHCWTHSGRTLEPLLWRCTSKIKPRIQLFGPVVCWVASFSSSSSYNSLGQLPQVSMWTERAFVIETESDRVSLSWQ